MLYLDRQMEEEEDAAEESGEDLEEIEQALYSQIYHHQVDSQEPQLFKSHGPRGDNPASKSSALLPSLSRCFPDSVCTEKTRNTKTKHRSSTHRSGIRRGIKRKYVEADDFIVDSDSEADTDQGPADHSSFALKDLHLHIHHDETLSKTADQENWSIIEQDRNPGAKTGNRYYGNLKLRCNNCNERSHMSRSCPQPKKQLVCYLCGLEGHNMAGCPNPVCYNCDSVTDHYARDCPEPRRRRFDLCRRCLMQGHVQRNCPDLWRQYHLTTGDGKLVQGEEGGNSRVYCHNCGEQGHLGYECEGGRMGRHSQPVYPFIARYHKYQPRPLPTNTARVQDGRSDLPEERPNKTLKLAKNIPKSWRLPDDQKTTEQRKKLKKTKRKGNNSGLQTGTGNLITLKTSKKKAKKKCDVLPEYSKVLAPTGSQKAAKKKKLENGMNAETVIVKAASYRRNKSKKKSKPAKSEKHLTEMVQKTVEAKWNRVRQKTTKRGQQSSERIVHFHTKRGFKVSLPDLHITTG